MATNKRDLKAYARFDGTGRIIPGSLVLRRTKPKNGNWKEIQTYECCDGGGCVSSYAIAMVGPNGGGLEDTRAYYSDRDLQNIAGQCANPSLAIGAKFYFDNQFTTPAADGTYAAVDPDAILFGIVYVVVNGIITDVLCP